MIPYDYLILFLLLALSAEILGTIGGFGSSLFFIPIAGYFLDFQSVLGITALFHVTSNLSKIYLFREGYDKKLILNIGIPAVIFVIIGAYLSKFANNQLLQLILSIFLICVSLLFLVARTLIINPSKRNSILGGAFSGLTAGLLGTGGAIRGATLAAFNLKTQVFIATSAIIDLGIDASRSVVYTMNGYVHYHDLYLIPLLFVISFIGSWIGKKILTRISQERFKVLVLLLIFVTGIVTLSKAIY